MPSPFSEQMAQARTVIEALTPEEGNDFTGITGALDTESEPAVIDRLFQVRSLGGPNLRVDLAGTRRARFAVVMRYVLGEQDDGEARIASDDDLIANALESSGNYVSALVRTVNHVDASTDETGRASGYLTRTRVFEVQYVGEAL